MTPAIVLAKLRANGPTPRRELAHTLGLHADSVSAILYELSREGLVALSFADWYAIEPKAES